MKEGQPPPSDKPEEPIDLAKQKRQREIHNQQLLDRTFWRGKYWENGQANPGGIKQDDGTLVRNGILFDVRLWRRNKKNRS